MISKQGRYSGYLRPINYLIDLLIIALFALQFDFLWLDHLSYILFTTIAWVILSIKTNFYEVYRFTRVTSIISRTFLQAAIFSFIVFSFFGIYEELNRPATDTIFYLTKVFAGILVMKLGIYYLLKEYRLFLKGNVRHTVIIGKNSKTLQLQRFFEENPEYGYHFVKLFDVAKKDEEMLHECFGEILQNEVDEIYCSIAELSNQQINQVVDFADNNLKVLKFLPDNKEIYTKQLEFDYYGYLPVLSLRKIPIEDPLNQFLKRVFDILVSLFVIVFLLSWLTPILAIFIKLGSKGPVFFKQSRNGLDYKEFYCYKFRSMKLNPQADLEQVSKNDPRITWIGKILRKTSFDEMPQFVNVLKGEMSVVGPRPHMVSHTHMYAESVDKFMVRHFVKPGITGLAQVSGFRGEVESEHHIINRVKYDIFYVENWSLILDIKIIFQTMYNALKGDERAY
ncbi:MAG TPA: exopolysaccharide biosynthesis polyprenyl glycosylphosphotransferase [Flavobacteriaceae bacterium]|nr:exopolysaccharide biosynthesis polyprenyl glycosylphosphotransferase [Flavobacteriaceae bacterium]